MSVPMEELVKNISSHYKLVLAAAQRANQLAKGAPPLIVTKSKKVPAIALEEIAKGKIHIEKLKKTKTNKP